jgi:hypothetical protein
MVRVLALSAVVLLTACGGGQDPLDDACLESPGAIERALARAPAPVRLSTGTRLSQCVANARNDADLQTAGRVLTRAADHLAAAAKRGDASAAVRLGYLVGAVRRGAAHTAGIHAELQRRIERTAAFLASTGALRRGLHAGEAKG